ncbi:polysaccharide pyruvyl transferase family protein [Serinicoccus kebangsaanensis]|uniref:polysaccharide pyruvyl transferase family protein n=1 Tax=Serinicoccus kebangsaanensis TaxID=2602069 RepID=UPI00124E444B|nr:polysaccharide pyruvyl transferase family protein [Serinicoccus kebangsaanensis]
MKRLRLFHFDIKTYGNYGDTLLFEAVRETFEGFGGGAYFEVAGSRPLRDPVGPKVMDRINSEFDAVVVGGGGLFLRDTNPNSRSGWQWNISLPMLRRLKIPLVVFAVGNNRFIGQEDFGPPFHEHLNLTLDKSVFVGLRNHGSVESIRDYVTHDPERVEYQPCPTTLASYLYPDLFRPSIENRRVIGAESIIGKRQKAVGFDADAIYRDQVAALSRLSAEGWSVWSYPHARADMTFHERLGEAGLVDREHILWGSSDVLFQGVQAFADLPVILGTRGHAQMVPFGMGSVPLSLHVHHKTRYFATDIGHPEWAIDPRADDFQQVLYRTVREVHENGPELREELAGVRGRFFDLTLDNLATIYERITGVRPPASFEPLTPRARRQADQLYHETFERTRLEEKLQAVRDASGGTPGGTTDQPRGAVRRAAGRAWRRVRRR